MDAPEKQRQLSAIIQALFTHLQKVVSKSPHAKAIGNEVTAQKGTISIPQELREKIFEILKFEMEFKAAQAPKGPSVCGDG